MSERFELVKRGYDPESVDRYIKSLEEQVAQYRSKDKAITNAIISAQQHADVIVANAKNQSRLVRENTAKQLQDIFESITTQRTMLGNFATDYNTLVTKYLKVVDNEDFKAINAKIDNLEGYLSDFADEVSEDLEIERRIPSTEEIPAITPSPAVALASVSDSDSDSAPVPVIRAGIH